MCPLNMKICFSGPWFHSELVMHYLAFPIFLILSSCLFFAEKEQGIFDAILRGHIDFVSEPWPSVSSNAKDLVKKMLRADTKERISAVEVLSKFTPCKCQLICFTYVRSCFFGGPARHCLHSWYLTLSLKELICRLGWIIKWKWSIILLKWGWGIWVNGQVTNFRYHILT